MSRMMFWTVISVVAAGLSAGKVAGSLSKPPNEDAPALVAVASTPSVPRTATLWADGRGHFQAETRIGTGMIRMLVDTGASIVALTESDARRAARGVSAPSGHRRIATANGIVEAPSVRIAELRIGDVAVRDIEAVIMPDHQLGTSLLGMSFLKRLRGFEISGQRLLLKS